MQQGWKNSAGRKIISGRMKGRQRYGGQKSIDIIAAAIDQYDECGND